MKLLLTVMLFLLYGFCLAQDPWKNIYSQHAWAERDKWQKSAELIRLMNISHGSDVADVGCHEGYMTFKLAEKVGKSGQVYAVDVDAGKLEKVRKRVTENMIEHIIVVKGDYDNPRLPENSLNAAIILDTYHEMKDHEEILQHIKTALKENGRLVICEPIADSRRNLSRSEQEKKHELALQYALDDLKKAGFKIFFQKDNFIDRTKEKGDKMWVVVAIKE
jgi:ubiquinone/menaquinone biosynthesis C-methylase UbiE